MRNNLPKFIFFGVVIVAIVVSGVLHPEFFVSGDASTGAAGSGAASSSGRSGPPLLVLPTLTADIGADAGPSSAATSGASDSNSAGATGTITLPTSTPFSRVGTAPAPNIGVSAALVADLDTGGSFLDMNAGERWPMASISKLMTAAVVTDVLDPTQKITITESMLAVDPSQQILHLGDTYTVADLLHVMLLPSNNVAAEAFAEFYGRTQFLAAMNAKAAAWGMTDTYYDDPSGLSAANESTANDLLKLAQHIYAQYPEILAITRMPDVTVQNLATGKPVTIKSINDFAGTPDFIGGKTGYTDQADGNLLSIFNYENRPIFIVILGIDDGVRFDATQQLYNWFKANFK